MECPKCHARMHRDRDGYLCWPAGCGHYVEDAPVEVMPEIPPRPELPARIIPQPRPTIRDDLMPHMALIRGMRRERKSWSQISAALRDIGVTVAPASIQKHHADVVVDMRQQGFKQVTIAKKLGMSVSNVKYICQSRFALTQAQA